MGLKPSPLGPQILALSLAILAVAICILPGGCDRGGNNDDQNGSAAGVSGVTTKPTTATTQAGRALDVDALLAKALPNLDDEAKPLSRYMGGGGLMLMFVDTSCPFCAAAMKEMPVVAQVLEEQKIAAVIINNDDSRERVKAFYAKNQPATKVVYDSGPATREAWNVNAVPTVIYITPGRNISYQGKALWADMGLAIEKSLSLPAGSIKFTSGGTSYG